MDEARVQLAARGRPALVRRWEEPRAWRTQVGEGRGCILPALHPQHPAWNWLIRFSECCVERNGLIQAFASDSLFDLVKLPCPSLSFSLYKVELITSKTYLTRILRV